MRTFIAEALEGEHGMVETAADGDEAAALLDRQAFDLVVTDLKMPGRDGLALLAKIRAEQPDTQVILPTAHGTVETAVAAMKASTISARRSPAPPSCASSSPAPSNGGSSSPPARAPPAPPRP